MRRTPRLVWILVGLALTSAFSATAYFVKEPMHVGRSLSRRALSAGGLQRKTFVAPAGRLTYWEGGEGPLLVLLHGMGDQAGTWNRVASRLAQSHRLLVPDLPGHGQSDPTAGPLEFSLFPAAVLALVDHEAPASPDEAPTRFSVMGSSMGGWVALRLALENPTRVERVWSVSGAGLYHDPAPIQLVPANREEAAALFDAVCGPRVPSPTGFFLDDYLETIVEGATPRVLAGLQMTDFLDGRLGSIQTPVEMIWGGADELLPLDYAERLRAGLPRAHLRVLPECGHVPQVECPQDFLDAFSASLDTTTGN